MTPLAEHLLDGLHHLVEAAEIAHALASRIVSDHGVGNVRWNPHAAAGAVLLEMHLVHRPQINIIRLGQFAEFFYALPGAQGPLVRLPGAVCVAESPVVGTGVGIAAHPVGYSTVAQ